MLSMLRQMLRVQPGMTHVGGWQTIFGRAVRERRQGLGLTLEEASAAVGISRSHLNLIELGKATGISRESVAKIDLGLGADGALLPLLPAGDSKDVAGGTTRDEEMRRAEFNKTMVAVAAGLLLDSERLVAPQRVDVALLEDLESLTAEFVRRQHHAQPQSFFGQLRAHLRHLLDLEGARVAPNVRPRLERVTAETAAVAGWIAFRGEGDLVTAHGQLALGRPHARAAADDQLISQLLGLC